MATSVLKVAHYDDYDDLYQVLFKDVNHEVKINIYCHMNESNGYKFLDEYFNFDHAKILMCEQNARAQNKTAAEMTFDEYMKQNPTFSVGELITILTKLGRLDVIQLIEDKRQEILDRNSMLSSLHSTNVHQNPHQRVNDHMNHSATNWRGSNGVPELPRQDLPSGPASTGTRPNQEQLNNYHSGKDMPFVSSSIDYGDLNQQLSGDILNSVPQAECQEELLNSVNSLQLNSDSLNLQLPVHSVTTNFYFNMTGHNSTVNIPGGTVSSDGSEHVFAIRGNITNGATSGPHSDDADMTPRSTEGASGTTRDDRDAPSFLSNNMRSANETNQPFLSFDRHMLQLGLNRDEEKKQLLVTYAVDSENHRKSITKLCKHLEHLDNGFVLAIDKDFNPTKTGVSKTEWLTQRIATTDAYMVCLSPLYIDIINGRQQENDIHIHPKNQGLSILDIYNHMETMCRRNPENKKLMIPVIFKEFPVNYTEMHLPPFLKKAS